MASGTAAPRVYPRKLNVETEAKLFVDFKDESGAAVNPTTVRFLLRSPGGSESSYAYGTNSEISRPSTGTYAANIQPDEAGVWAYRWVTTGPVIAAEGRINVVQSVFFDNWNSDYA